MINCYGLGARGSLGRLVSGLIQLQSDGQAFSSWGLVKAAWQPGGLRAVGLLIQWLQASSEQGGNHITFSDLALEATLYGFLVLGKAQTHLGLRRGHWLPSLDGIGQEILLMGIFGKTTGHDLPSGHNKFTSLPHAKYMAAIPRPSKSLMPIWFQAQAQPQSRALPSNHLPDTYL